MSGLNRASLIFTSIDLSLREFERYREQMERYFVQERGRIDEEFETLDPRNDESGNMMAYVEYLSDCYQDLETSFPYNFRSSFLIQILSFVEYELKKLCNLHSQFTKSVFYVNDLKGSSDYEKVRKYLERAANVDFELLNPEWKNIRTIYKARNKFVHQTGVVLASDDELNEIKKLRYLTVKIELEDSDDKPVEYLLVLEKEFNKMVIDTAKEFFRKLLVTNKFDIPIDPYEIFKTKT